MRLSPRRSRPEPDNSVYTIPDLPRGRAVTAIPYCGHPEPNKACEREGFCAYHSGETPADADPARVIVEHEGPGKIVDYDGFSVSVRIDADGVVVLAGPEQLRQGSP